MRTILRTMALAFVLAGGGLSPLAAQEQVQEPRYSPNELVNAGHQFFETVSRGLAGVIEKAVSQWGQPNGYVLGQEAGGGVATHKSPVLHQSQPSTVCSRGLANRGIRAP